jgi:RHS repeat-associated protein
MAVRRMHFRRSSSQTRKRQFRRIVVAVSGVVLGATLTALVPPTVAAATALQTTPNIPVRPVTSHYQTPPQVPKWHAGPTTWPTGSATASITGVEPARAGTLPVWIGAIPGTSLGRVSADRPMVTQARPAPGRVAVSVAPATTSETLGVNGIVLSVRPTAGAGATDAARVSVDYTTFADAFGGDWSSRLRLVELPACALTTPTEPGCRTQTPLRSTNDGTTSTISTDIALPATAVIAATAGTDSSQGDFTATSLKPSSAWQAGGSADSFAYSYPISVPPVPGGLEPDVTLSYDSQSVDGLTSSTNNQASWIGDGWNYSPGFIERSYESCDVNPTGATKTNDNCWSNSNTLTLSLGGHTTQLVKDDATGTYHPQNDNHERVQYMTGAVNGAQNGEYFVVTTTDGTQYVFGKNELPGYMDGAGDATTNSVWTEPVFATAAGQPCFNATFSLSWCQQAYRWNLDYVVDTHSDAVSYFYNTETNVYARDNGATDTSYIRGGVLAKIEYGQRDGAVYTTTPAAEVDFTSTGRCDLTTCDPAGLTSTTASHWPDVPFDLSCATGSACTNETPSFFSELTLQSIQTKTLVGTSLTTVDSWALAHTFPDPGDQTPGTTGTTPSLWLSSIQHSGQDTTAGGSSAPIALPAITFTSVPLANRVNLGEGYPPLTRQRMHTIKTETGEIVTVSYSSPACGTATPTESTNTSLCYPAFWTPVGQTAPIEDWFNKFIVTGVTEEDPTGGSANDTIATTYTPVGSPAWHFDDNPLTRSGERTWNDWRGFEGMIVSTGTAPDPITKTQYTYFRGMDGDTLPGGATRSVAVTDSRGDPAVTDSNQFEGATYETQTFNGASVVTDEIDTPFSSAATAGQAESGLPTLKSFLTGLANTRTYTPLAGGTTRETETDYTHDSAGRVVATNDLGDVSTSTDDLCSTTSFVDNTTKWILNDPSEQKTVSVNCGVTAPPNSAAVSDELSYYDSATVHGTAPTIGDLTESQNLISFTGTTPNYATTTDTFDQYGRPLSETDPDSRVSSTTYTPAAGAEPTQIVAKDPLTHLTTTTLDPMRDLPLTAKDAAGFVTSQQYDALGRLTQVTKPGISSPALKYSYTVSNSGPSVVDTSTLNTDGTYRLSESLYDSLLRLRETQTQVPDSTPTNPTDNPRVVTDTIYNSDGWQAETTNPYSNGDPVSPTLVQAQVGDVPPETSTTYDGAGRKTADISLLLGVETWRTSYSYGGDSTTTVPPAGGTAQTTVTDARGNTTDLFQYHGGVPANPADPPADFSDTHYTYTPANRQATVKDAAGNTWSYAYDLLGDQTSAGDPDAGVTTNTYDAAGQLLTTTDGRGKQSTTQYDKDGRKTGAFDTTGGVAPVAANQTAAWTYDATFIGAGTTKAVGYLSTTTSISGGDTFKQTIKGYNLLAQVSSETSTLTGTDAALLPAAGLNTTYRYSITGYQTDQVDPAAANLPSEDLTTNYDQFGEPTGLGSGVGAIVDAVGYSPFGQPLQYTMPGTAGDVDLALAYDQQTQNLTEVKATDTAQAAAVDDLTYRYGGNGVSKGTGLVTSVTDSQNAGAVLDTQCFTYDYADRLGQAWTGTDACTSTPAPGASSTVGGPNPYWQSWSYDAAGDRSTEVDHDLTGNTANDTAVNYHYPAAGSSTDQPHTLTSTSATGPGATPRTASYAYDAVGDTTSITGGLTGNESLTWNDQDQLATDTSTSGTTSYAYDADGNLLVQRDPTQTTLYIGDEQLVRNDATGVTSGTRFYTIGGATIASRSGTAPPVYLIPDRQGTDQLTIDSNTYAVTRRQFLPFGGTRGAAPTLWPGGDKSYVGGTFDSSTSLENLGAREYDPYSGRFLSADPVFEATDPTQIGGFDYAGNDPITGEDPSGLMLDGGGQCGILPSEPCFGSTGGQTSKPGPARGSDGSGEPSPPAVHHNPAPSDDDQSGYRGGGGKAAGEFPPNYHLDPSEGPPAWEVGLTVIANIGAGIASTFGEEEFDPAVVEMDRELAEQQAKARRASEGVLVLFGQRRIGANFSPEGAFHGRSIKSVAADLDSGRISPDSVVVHVFNYDGHVVAENNRSLAALSLAGFRPTNIQYIQPTSNVMKRLRERTPLGDVLPSARIAITPTMKNLSVQQVVEVP